MVSVLFISDWDASDQWHAQLQHHLPAVRFHRFADAAYDPADIDAALVWKPPAGVLAGLPNLRLIASLGMGVDHIFADPTLPEGVPITRIIDDDLVDRMADYVLHAVLHYHRQQDYFDARQHIGQWQPISLPHASENTVGILGLGTIGQECARRLRMMKFQVAGWRQHQKPVDDIDCFYGPDQLDHFLARCDYLVCLLPLTSATRGLLDRKRLACLPQGAVLINAARGAHIVDDDLITALDHGPLARAHLDAFDPEPLPKDHPFWSHPAVRLTPHIAGSTNPATAGRQVADNLRRLKNGEPLHHLVDQQREY